MGFQSYTLGFGAKLDHPSTLDLFDIICKKVTFTFDKEPEIFEDTEDTIESDEEEKIVKVFLSPFSTNKEFSELMHKEDKNNMDIDYEFDEENYVITSIDDEIVEVKGYVKRYPFIKFGCIAVCYNIFYIYDSENNNGAKRISNETMEEFLEFCKEIQKEHPKWSIILAENCCS